MGRQAGAMTQTMQTDGPAQVVVPVADILDRPDGARQRQLLYGAVVDVTGTDGDWVDVRARRDGWGRMCPRRIM